jgi:hypothetical protein
VTADINLITPPDRLFNNSISFLLVYPSDVIKEQFNNLLKNMDVNVNVYLYEQTADDHETDWLLTSNKIADYTIIDIDNCPSIVQTCISYLIANPTTYWLTKAENMFYNKISNKRIYSVDYFADKIGGNFETQTTNN